MLDTIVYIPTILAYAFISLLVVILCFIVIYISHKIYTSVYDYLPTPQTMLSSFIGLPDKIVETSRKSDVSYAKPERPPIGRKSKTAMRLIVTVEPIYLAYVVFETSKRVTNTDKRFASPEALGTHLSFSDFFKHTKLVKYYDQLREIPMGKIMQRCDAKTDEKPASGSHTPNNSVAEFGPIISDEDIYEPELNSESSPPSASEIEVMAPLQQTTEEPEPETSSPQEATTTTEAPSPRTVPTFANALRFLGESKRKPPSF